MVNLMYRVSATQFREDTAQIYAVARCNLPTPDGDFYEMLDVFIGFRFCRSNSETSVIVGSDQHAVSPDSSTDGDAILGSSTLLSESLAPISEDVVSPSDSVSQQGLQMT
eukprot:gnl/MRDRNA2_/MRDRNA2_77597_c0_seq1.p1 gnl/MRDRNA2_/MRDRNA2_77597_c0~~gnl/MRDRNA2_/MRDRNA2_77597_c0_seq1.p1  ORF type:complete len:125 (+),score=21.54 gnl/MRDRNA2_/MRDRNA2_77597_c0_seq1:47-376(+)